MTVRIFTETVFMSQVKTENIHIYNIKIAIR